MDGRIQVALDCIHQRHAEPISVDVLARAANLSRSRFTCLFRRATGVSPARYLRRVRLERARELLLATPMTIRNVMAAVGFTDPSHFSRGFRSYYGESPVALRRAASRRGGRGNGPWDARTLG